ncbi:S41 family peptidase [Algoriphagus terrigena]|uniref:S41 family peptidase n=1 Tax=Algoriphagus terrigena TaxID=344884 RepID=UPI00040A12E1|nr:S41 family peptidase [Algoriphagus terrigena]
MKNLSLSILITFLFSLFACAQNSETHKLNLDFEESGKGFPSGWESFGSQDYKIYIDSLTAKSGKFSAVIESAESPSDFKALAFNLPNNYNGKSIKLSGFIKTENVSGGFAGLWMRIDPGIALDNMSDRGITGTTDWKEYEITLPLNPKNTQQIIVGGLLSGKGKMWLDDLRVSIDGKDLNDAGIEIYKPEILPAQHDKEFDNGSSIVFPDLDPEVMDNLELLGRIWGFLKYHHPEIAKGKYNWDYELFRVLPSYLDAKNSQERDNVLTAWLEKYGSLNPCENCKTTANDAVLKPNLSWIDDSNLSVELKSKIKDIYTNRNQDEHYYIGLHPGVGNPQFTNENSYSDNPYPDSGFRLLSLYRYWNMIEYFFPYKHLTDKEWSGVLREYLPGFINASNELEYELAAIQIIGDVKDTHANLWGGGDKISELRGSNFAPFRGEFVENKFVVADYYNPEFSEKSKLKIGDIITHIDGKTIDSLVDSLKTYYPVSNEASLLRDVSIDLLRSSDSTLNLTYVSENQTLEHELPLHERGSLNMYHWYKVDKDQKCYRILDGNIGYITLANIKEEDIPEIKKSFINTKGIIIDIRNYPSTFVPFALGTYFMSESTPFVKFTVGNVANPGEFTLSGNLEIPSQGNTYTGKLVVLVNENSQSQAEYTAMAFRAVENSAIVGSTTAGADGNVSEISLPGGLRTMISGIGVYYPDGTETQRAGIVPDFFVTPTIEGVKKGGDEVLSKAIEIINQ